MKNWIYIIMIGLLGSLVSSCQQSLDDEVQTPLNTPRAANISMCLVFDEQPVNSRNANEEPTWGKGEDNNNNEYNDGLIGEFFENEIDITNPNALQAFVQVFDGNRMVEELEVVEKTILRLDIENGRVYSLDGILDLNNTSIENGTYTCRVVVYANSESGKNVFTYSRDARIPMWGVRKTEINLAYGAENEIEDIYLLRALAKVEVKLDSSIANDFKLTSVVVDKYNLKGNVLPTGYDSATDTRNLSQQGVFNPYKNEDESHFGSNLVINDDEENPTGIISVYLPEYDNSADAATITVVINEQEYTIEFKDYEEGKATDNAYNIVRNHYYQYTITSVGEQSVEVDFALRYQVMDWTNVVNPGMSFE